MDAKPATGRYLAVLTLGALGVVYGDIGTSPLYALRECFAAPHGMAPTHANVLGVLSLIFWSLLLIVSFKYLAIVLRATNKGEGGILAIMALAFPRHTPGAGRRRALLIALGVFGAALLYGDGMITPSITVLSAMEGLKVATPAFDHFIIPLTILTLIGLFAAQSRGTGRVGAIFGPIMLVWFGSLAALGIAAIHNQPEVLYSLNPALGLRFLLVNGWAGFVVLGAVFLAVTGAEALYADVGHFGARPIRIAWFAVVLPGLFLNYLGQGALILKDPDAIENPFYLLCPHWALLPMVCLATAAGVIASQALISGAFSLTIQAIQLGYLPRIAVKHTSSRERGQIYIPHVNWALMVACIGLVLGFESSSNMAAAYGIAVTLTMLCTTILFYFAARRLWDWSFLHAASLSGLFLVVEAAFFGANLLKVLNGGWFPLVSGLVIFTLMATWKTGRQLVWDRLRPAAMPLEMFLDSIETSKSLCRVPGTALFMTANPEGTPIALLHNLKHNKVLHERNIILTIVTDEVPQVNQDKRIESEKLAQGFHRLIAHYGFMEEPNVPELLAAAPFEGEPVKLHKTTFFLSRETIVPTTKSRSMVRWRKWLFAVMSRNAQSASSFYRIPANRVVELGMQVEL
ncbi:MAG TPA: potassium transporter Kup [Candidatus Limnocylindrales bacterium]|jgi:KUP system potassium uptake protein|nr:potassium transporter Kup [Candidatus Limnocylindrales bacterium]